MKSKSNLKKSNRNILRRYIVHIFSCNIKFVINIFFLEKKNVDFCHYVVFIYMRYWIQLFLIRPKKLFLKKLNRTWRNWTKTNRNIFVWYIIMHTFFKIKNQTAPTFDKMRKNCSNGKHFYFLLEIMNSSQKESKNWKLLEKG